MNKSHRKAKEEARRLYLAGEMNTNAEIAARLKLKPHTVARWRKDEAWDDLRLKIDRRAAEMFVEKIATDRVTLNVRPYRLWEVILTRLLEDLKQKKGIDIREMDPMGRFPRKPRENAHYPIIMGRGFSANLRDHKRQGELAFTCRGSERGISGPKTAHEMPISD